MYQLTGNYLKDAEVFLAGKGFEPFRARQILHWIYKKFIFDFEKMINLPQDLRQFLKKETKIIPLAERTRNTSSQDGTTKYLFKLEDSLFIESVFLPFQERTSLCLSTQVGCALSCRFCASGQKGFIRNLETEEIIGQWLLARKENVITNIIFMGMGEPLLNYDNLIKAIEILTSTWGAGLSSRHVAISTAGIIPGIKKLAAFSKQVKLSISLHSLRDDVRTRLMPINKKYPVAEVLKAARFYAQKTNKLITFEYLLIGEVNDRREDAEALAKAMANIPSKVNLIVYNQVDKSIFKPPAPDRIRQFKEILNRYGINFIEREKKGGDIEAACGQLYLRSLKG